MNIRRTLSILTIAALASTGVACSNKQESKDANGKGNGKTEQAKDSKSEDSKSGEKNTETTTTLGDADFAKAINQIKADVKASGTDECALLNAIKQGPPMPGNTDQTKQFIEVYVQLLNAISGVIGPETENGKILNETATKLGKAAAEKAYSVDLLDDKSIAAIMSSEELNKALSDFSQRTIKCTGAAGGN